MKISSLRLQNFGPYYGTHEVDLSTPDGAPLILVHADNMRGKTTLINALRWCLYGHVRNRTGQDKEVYRLLNLDAVDEGTFALAVTMHFEHEGVKYELERRATANTRPQSDEDLKTDCRLLKNGAIQPAADIPEALGGILHEDIARFFFFDGEMLQEYEVLLERPDTSTDLVRRSIEEILGLPALDRARTDLSDLSEMTQKKLVKALGKLQKNNKLLKDAESTADQLDAAERDLADLRPLFEEVTKSLALLQDRRKEYVALEKDLARLDQLESQVRHEELRQEALQKEIAAILRESWWLPISAKARVIYDAAQARVLEISRHDRTVAGLEREILSLEETLRDKRCTTCGQPLPTDSKSAAATTAKLDALRQSLVELGETPVTAEADHFTLHSLKAIVDSGPAERLREKERTRLRSRIDARRLKNECQDIQERLRNHDRAEIKRVEQDYVLCIAKYQQLDGDIRRLESSRETLKANLARLRAQVEQMPGADAWISREAAIYGSLQALFDGGLERFRVLLRNQVEEEASEIFLQLTTEPDYAGLRINDRYGLTIVDKHGRNIRDRSAGAEEVVALALIGALNRCSLREAPVVMDTPFGRLDVRHSDRILKFLATMGRQVLLLVQSREFNRERDFKLIADKVGREMTILRDGRPTRSRIATGYQNDGVTS